MDFQNYSNIQNNPNQFNNRRNTAMEAAAFILSIISVSTCTCIYVSIVCGALAIIFAILSKGGANSMSSRACLALGIGVVGIVLTFILYGISIATLYLQYGSIDAMLRAIYEQAGFDYDSLMQMY